MNDQVSGVIGKIGFFCDIGFLSSHFACVPCNKRMGKTESAYK